MPCPPQLLKQFALQIAKFNHQSKIIHIQEHYLGFWSLDKELFSLGFEGNYALLNKPNPGGVAEHIEDIGNGLFSVLRQLNCYPVIKYFPSHTLCAQLAAFLAQKFELLFSTEVVDKGEIAHEMRTLLVLYDRNIGNIYIYIYIINS